MKAPQTVRRHRFARLVAALSLGFVALGSAASDLPKPTFDNEGHLNRPVRYREWVYIGTPLTPNDLNPPEAAFPEFHNVYIHPADFDHWRDHGTFPDGTVIIKELVSVGSKQAVSGNGYFMGDFVGLEATVKDSERFPDEPGHWAYFSFGHAYPLADTAAAFPTASCNACHEASAADDFVFVQYYPVLRAAKGDRSGRTMTPGDRDFDAIESAMAGALEGALQASAPRGDIESNVPIEEGALIDFLRAGRYKQFSARESSTHPSRGPHTKFGLPVRVYLDPVIHASLEAGRDSHPAGAAIVKEMFSADGELAGWAVMVKTEEESDGGRGWFWYEVTSTRAGAAPVASGNGVPLCFGLPRHRRRLRPHRVPPAVARSSADPASGLGSGRPHVGGRSPPLLPLERLPERLSGGVPGLGGDLAESGAVQ